MYRIAFLLVLSALIWPVMAFPATGTQVKLSSATEECIDCHSIYHPVS